MSFCILFVACALLCVYENYENVLKELSVSQWTIGNVVCTVVSWMKHLNEFSFGFQHENNQINIIASESGTVNVLWYTLVYMTTQLVQHLKQFLKQSAKYFSHNYKLNISRVIMQRRYQKCKHLPSARANTYTQHNNEVTRCCSVVPRTYGTLHIYIRFFVCWTYARERTVPGFPIFFFFPTVCIFTSEFLFSHSISYSVFLRQNYFH